MLKGKLLVALTFSLLVGCQISTLEESTDLLTSEDSTEEVIESSLPIVNYTITFHANREDVTDPLPVEVRNGSSLSANKVPTLYYEGDVFLGWFKDIYALYPFDNVNDYIYSDLDLYGKWQSKIIDEDDDNGGDDPGVDPDLPVRYNVSYYYNFESSPSPVVKKVFEGRTAQYYELKRVGYGLVGYYLEPELVTEYDFANIVNSDLDLYAKWNAKTLYHVTFNYNYSGSTSKVVDVYENEKVARPESPVRENYAFDNWYTTNSLNVLFSFSTPINSNIELFGKWSRSALPGVYFLFPDSWLENSATFTLWNGKADVNGVSTIVPGEYYFDGAATSYLAIKRKVGSSQVGQVYGIAASGGWGTSWNQVVVKPTTPNTGSNNDNGTGTFVTLQLRDNSVDEAALLNITFDLNYPGSSSFVRQTFEGHTITQPATPVRDGFVFKGWHLNQVTDTPYDFNTLVETEFTLYAHWEEAIYATVTFNPNYDDIAPTQVSVVVGSLLTQPSISRTGYVLEGWYLEDTKWNFSTDVVTGPVTLVAHWEVLSGLPMSVTRFYLLIQTDFAYNITKVKGLPANVEVTTREAVGEGWVLYGFAEGAVDASKNSYFQWYFASGSPANIYNLSFTGFGTTWNVIVVKQGIAQAPNGEFNNFSSYLQKTLITNTGSIVIY